jgi:hypothetical protein
LYLQGNPCNFCLWQQVTSKTAAIKSLSQTTQNKTELKQKIIKVFIGNVATQLENAFNAVAAKLAGNCESGLVASTKAR